MYLQDRQHSMINFWVDIFVLKQCSSRTKDLGIFLKNSKIALSYNQPSPSPQNHHFEYYGLVKVSE